VEKKTRLPSPGEPRAAGLVEREIGVLLPNNQRQQMKTVLVLIKIAASRKVSVSTTVQVGSFCSLPGASDLCGISRPQQRALYGACNLSELGGEQVQPVKPQEEREEEGHSQPPLGKHVRPCWYESRSLYQKSLGVNKRLSYLRS